MNKAKSITVAAIILISLILLTLANVLICDRAITEIAEDAESISIGDTEKAETLKKDFRRAAFFLSITVNHDDIDEAHAELIELVCVAKSGDPTALEIAKSRLIAALDQLKRLSGIGIDSII